MEFSCQQAELIRKVLPVFPKQRQHRSSTDNGLCAPVTLKFIKQSILVFILRRGQEARGRVNKRDVFLVSLLRLVLHVEVPNRRSFLCWTLKHLCLSSYCRFSLSELGESSRGHLIKTSQPSQPNSLDVEGRWLNSEPPLDEGSDKEHFKMT